MPGIDICRASSGIARAIPVLQPSDYHLKDVREHTDKIKYFVHASEYKRRAMLNRKI
jgi:hypothetical protein